MEDLGVSRDDYEAEEQLVAALEELELAHDHIDDIEHQLAECQDKMRALSTLHQQEVAEMKEQLRKQANVFAVEVSELSMQHARKLTAVKTYVEALQSEVVAFKDANAAMVAEGALTKDQLARAGNTIDAREAELRQKDELIASLRHDVLDAEARSKQYVAEEMLSMQTIHHEIVGDLSSRLDRATSMHVAEVAGIFIIIIIIKSLLNNSLHSASIRDPIAERGTAGISMVPAECRRHLRAWS
jgi:hypothetical protein